jgi:UDP-N-acetylmuramate--alanine ligase
MSTISVVPFLLPRVTVIFQPHRYSRTRLLREGFGRALAAADAVFVTSIYAGPGEVEEQGVSSSFVSDAVKATGHGSVELIDSAYDAAAEAARRATAGDVIITMGAGDVWKTHTLIRETLTDRRQ